MNKTYLIKKTTSKELFTHETFDSAVKEATRLARATPGTDFVIFEAVRSLRTSEAPVETTIIQDKYTFTVPASLTNLTWHS